MPRTNFCRDKTKDEMKMLSSMIRCQMGIKNYSIPKLANRIGIPERTLRNKINNPEDIKLKELRKICSELNLKIVVSEEAKELEML